MRFTKTEMLAFQLLAWMAGWQECSSVSLPAATPAHKALLPPQGKASCRSANHLQHQCYSQSDQESQADSDGEADLD
jgi:hypothetical protein